ncbi:MAG: tyrosine-type recombinase/integrase [Tannerellaceae bacterium]|nr:tyrosine-type recombinase/integrase [Tannerellaceae bacterium]
MQNNNADHEGITIGKAIEDFLFHCQYEKNLNAKTLNAYQIDLKQFVGYMQTHPDKQAISSIRKEELKGYLQLLSSFKPKTIKRKIASLKAMFNFLEYEYDNFINPFRKIKIRLKEPYTLPTVMNMQEIKRILQTVYKHRPEPLSIHLYSSKAIIRDIAVIELLFATGIRVSELCGLQAGDVDLRNGRIKVFGKGSKERIIQICQSEVLTALKEYYKIFKDSIQQQSYFFINRLGHPLSTQSVRLMVRHYTTQAGITKHVTPHTFRHTFATLLLEEDIDIKYIQNLLGHSTISTTQIYTHVNAGKQKRILSTKHPRRKINFQ